MGLVIFDFNMTQEEFQEEYIPGDIRLEMALRGERFAWRDERRRGRRLALFLKRGGYLDYAKRAEQCATKLQFYAMENGDKQLFSANFCHLRLCPMCTARRARRAAYKLSKILNKVEADHPGVTFLFMTLTVENCDGDKLGDTLGLLTRAWKSLIDQRKIQRAIKGWFRAIEITHGKETGYHPHIHAIIAVEPEYFKHDSPLYITQDELARRWQMALKVDYKPIVHIEKTKNKKDGMGAALEAAKYVVKDEDYIDPELPEDEAVQIVKDYTAALHRRRLTAFGGWLKEVAQLFDAGNLDDGDLVHVEDETIRADIADYIETYEWHFGAGDYILTSRRVNPLRVIKAEGV